MARSVRSFLLIALVILILILVMAFLLDKFRKIKPGVAVDKLHKMFLTRDMIILYMTVVCLFPITEAVADERREAKYELKCSPRVGLVFKTADLQAPEDELRKANKNSVLSLLAQTKDLVIVFVRKDGIPKHAQVFVLARTELSSVHIFPRESDENACAEDW